MRLNEREVAAFSIYSSYLHRMALIGFYPPKTSETGLLGILRARRASNRGVWIKLEVVSLLRIIRNNAPQPVQIERTSAQPRVPKLLFPAMKELVIDAQHPEGTKAHKFVDLNVAIRSYGQSLASSAVSQQPRERFRCPDLGGILLESTELGATRWPALVSTFAFLVPFSLGEPALMSVLRLKRVGIRHGCTMTNLSFVRGCRDR